MSLGALYANYNLQKQFTVCSLRSAVCGLQSAVCGLRSAVCKCHTPGVPIAGFHCR